jgi:hypothetical protein
MSKEEGTAASPTPEVLQQEISALATRMETIAKYLNEGLAEQVKKTVTDTLTPVVEAIQKKFESHETALTQLAQRGGGGGGSTLIDIVKGVIEKIPTGGGGGGGFAAETESIMRDIIKTDLKEMLYTARARARAPQGAEHMTIEPKH